MNSDYPPLPEKLYKYRSLDEKNLPKTKDIITQNRVWFASPITFNDPFDCTFPLNFETTKANSSKYFREQLIIQYPKQSKSDQKKLVQQFLHRKDYKKPEFTERLNQ